MCIWYNHLFKRLHISVSIIAAITSINAVEVWEIATGLAETFPHPSPGELSSQPFFSTGINCCHPGNNRAQWCQLYLIDWVKHTQISQNNGHKNLYMTPPVKSSACLFHFHATQQAVGPVLKRSLRRRTPSPIKLPAPQRCRMTPLDIASNCCPMNEG